jgi:hypothetical protein
MAFPGAIRRDSPRASYLNLVAFREIACLMDSSLEL